MSAVFVVEHAMTTDMDDGQALPPLITDGVVWRVVHRLPDGRTYWRRIHLVERIDAGDDSVGDAP
jgi:hypothetical protein